MKQLLVLSISALLMAGAVHASHTRTTPDIALADETLSDATAQRVLEAAAPQLGTTAATLYAEYQGGRVSITDLGPSARGHSYGVTRGTNFIIIDEWAI
jgi:hypothetical protein